MNMIDRYLARNPPEAFYVHEIEGAVRPTLIPFDGPAPAPARPPIATDPEGAATMTSITREELDDATMELAAAAGVSVAMVRDATLELAVGDSSGSETFASRADEAEALTSLAAHLGVWSGDALPDPAAEVAAEVARITALASTREYITRTGECRVQFLVDHAKAAAALQPRPRPYQAPPDAAMSVYEQDEIDRLLTMGLSRPSPPPSEVEGRYLQLAREYESNGTTVTEEDTTEYTDETLTGDEIDAEVARYHNQAAQLFGVTPQNDNGNRSYAPPDRSTFGQFQSGP